MTSIAPVNKAARRGIRAWRSDDIRACDCPDAARLEAERLFVAGIEPPERARMRLAGQLRHERVMGAGRRTGYDLARHAALARALSETLAAARKCKTPRG